MGYQDNSFNNSVMVTSLGYHHDDVIKSKCIPRYRPFVRGTTGHRWIPLTKAGDVELWCFVYLLCSSPFITMQETFRYWCGIQCGQHPIDSVSVQAACMWHINTLRPRQNGRHFPDDIFKCIFVNENAWISITILLTFVPKGPINNIPTLV